MVSPAARKCALSLRCGSGNLLFFLSLEGRDWVRVRYVILRATEELVLHTVFIVW